MEKEIWSTAKQMADAAAVRRISQPYARRSFTGFHFHTQEVDDLADAVKAL